MNEEQATIKLAELSEQIGNIKQAIQYYEDVLPCDKDRVYGNLARLYSQLYGFEKKEQCIKYAMRAYELNPNDKINLDNLAMVFNRYGMLLQACPLYEMSLKIEELDQIKFNYGCCLIQDGRFKEGFKLYHTRVNFPEIIPEGVKNVWMPDDDITNKTILITHEQGFGDTFMFMRFIKYIIPKCKKVYFLPQKQLKDLCNIEGCELVTQEHIKDLQYDYCIPLLTLPYILNITYDNIPDKNGYIDIPEQDVKEYEQKYLKKDCIRIGLAYSGYNGSKTWIRDIPFKYLEPLFDLKSNCGKEIKFYDFQYENVSDCDKTIKLRTTYTKDWYSTACAMKNMDYMICTDNGCLNLAGALGVKTYGLFNRYTEHRWFTFRDDIGWYNIKAFKCLEHNGWQFVVYNLKEELKSQL